MVYLILCIGLIVALASLYRFFLKAEARQVKAMLLSVASGAVALAALGLAVTGRLPAAIAILTALWPLGIAYMRTRAQRTINAGEAPPLTEKEAYEVLGLPDGAPMADVRAAHLRLMKKLHPDAAGSHWLAQKINTARDIILKNP